MKTDKRNRTDFIHLGERESKERPNEELPRGKMLTIRQAVQKTGIGKDWFYRHMDEGTLPFPWYPLAKRLMDSADIDDWLRMRKVPAGKMPGDI